MVLFRWLFLPPILLAVGFAAGWRVQTWRGAAQVATAERHVVAVTRNQGAISVAAAVKDQAAEDRVRTAAKTLVREVPIHVTPATDLRFPLPVGLVRVHDAAALGRDLPDVPDPAGRPDDAASGVAASVAAGVIAANYGDCRAQAERLTALQDWVAAQARAFSASPGG